MLETKKQTSIVQWYKSGEPWIWFNAGAVTICVLTVVGLLFLLAVRGFGHFWPTDILEATYTAPDNLQQQIKLIGEISEHQTVSIEQLQSAGLNIKQIDHISPFLTRYLVKVGNRDITGKDFTWVLEPFLENVQRPKELVVIERKEWGNFYGRVIGLQSAGENKWQASAEAPFDITTNTLYQELLSRAQKLTQDIADIEKVEISAINHNLERLRLRQRKAELDYGAPLPADHVELKEINSEKAVLEARYEELQKSLAQLYEAIARDTLVTQTSDGTTANISFAKIVHILQPNKMSLAAKTQSYLQQFWLFLTEEPREANTEGGIFPAIFGTVMMVLLMSIIVTPFGVIAAVYLHEYAKQGIVTRLIRIAVNNLAGVPSIVYGVFGLGFFVYFIGAGIDKIFFPEVLPAPTFGTPGLLWASLTLALLTLPVVIVATEEGLARIPRSVREGSLALGATKAETLWQVVIPMASPAMMTGLILAVARAAGEVAPLMLVGVVKLAPSLPINGNYPFVHLDQKFMHLGFHIYDVGFQSPNVEAARPLVYATSLLLVLIIAILNFSAVSMRNHLREKYKALES